MLSNLKFTSPPDCDAPPCGSRLCTRRSKATRRNPNLSELDSFSSTRSAHGARGFSLARGPPFCTSPKHCSFDLRFTLGCTHFGYQPITQVSAECTAWNFTLAPRTHAHRHKREKVNSMARFQTRRMICMQNNEKHFIQMNVGPRSRGLRCKPVCGLGFGYPSTIAKASRSRTHAHPRLSDLDEMPTSEPLVHTCAHVYSTSIYITN